MQNATDFYINQKPVSITLTCPNCGTEQVIPWSEVQEPESWSDDWGTVTCPDCGEEIQLGSWDM